MADGPAESPVEFDLVKAAESLDEDGAAAEPLRLQTEAAGASSSSVCEHTYLHTPIHALLRYSKQSSNMHVCSQPECAVIKHNCRAQACRNFQKSRGL